MFTVLLFDRPHISVFAIQRVKASDRAIKLAALQLEMLTSVADFEQVSAIPFHNLSQKTPAEKLVLNFPK